VEEAEKIERKVEEGEDLDKLTKEVWREKESEGKVDDLGWLPRGVMTSEFDQIAFNLIIGDVSEPLPYVRDPASTEIFYDLLMVSEKADAREVDEDSLQILKAKALYVWLSEETKFHKIEWNFNPEIYAWINWQLQRR